MTPDQIKDYREPTWKIVSNTKYPTDKSSDNGALFTAEYILQASDPGAEKETFKAFVDACQIQPGLYSRYPGDLDLNSWDNYIGIAAASVKMGLSYHQDILKWGEDHGWTWNNQTPQLLSVDSFLGRYPTFVPFLQMICGKPPSPADVTLYIMGNEASALTPIGNESGKCLQYLMNKSVIEKHAEIDLSIWLWQAMMARKYNGMKDVYAHYFGVGHPLALYGPSDFN